MVCVWPCGFAHPFPLEVDIEQMRVIVLYVG
jgi:hypothetical protein